MNTTWDEHKAVLQARLPFRDLLLRRIGNAGETHYVSVSGKPIFDAGGIFKGYRGVATDVTQRIEAEERFRATFEQAAVGMAMRDIDPHKPRWLRVNQKLCDILGYTAEELLQLTSVELTPPEDRGLAIDYNEQLERGEIASYSREKRYVRKDGQIIWTNISLSAVRGPDGRPTQHHVDNRRHLGAQASRGTAAQSRPRAQGHGRMQPRDGARQR